MKIIEISDEEVKHGLSHQYEINHAEDFYVKGYHSFCTKKIVDSNYVMDLLIKDSEFLKTLKNKVVNLISFNDDFFDLEDFVRFISKVIKKDPCYNVIKQKIYDEYKKAKDIQDEKIFELKSKEFLKIAKKLGYKKK